MSGGRHTEAGAVVSLWRYPVKSMTGEELHAARLSNYGLLGDRAYALIDPADGKIATAKNPRKWPTRWISGTYTVVDASGATIDSGSYPSVHRRTNSAWLYIRDTWNSDRPPAPPAPPSSQK